MTVFWLIYSLLSAALVVGTAYHWRRPPERHTGRPAGEFIPARAFCRRHAVQRRREEVS